jgi:hypothetical protein
MILMFQIQYAGTNLGFTHKGVKPKRKVLDEILSALQKWLKKSR